MQSSNVSVTLMCGFAILSCVSGFGTDRFMGAPASALVAKQKALHMWAAAEAEQHEATVEEREAIDHAADAKAIHAVAVNEAKVDEARARKELKGEDLNAMLAVVRDEEAREGTDVKQIEDIAAKEKKDAAATRNDAARVRHDATEAETAADPDIQNATQTIVKPTEKTTSQTVLGQTGTCPSTKFYCGMEKNAAGTTIFTEHDLTPNQCHMVMSTLPEDGQFKICGPGTFSISAMSCDKHDYKAKTIEHPTDAFTVSNCKVYNVKDYYVTVGSVTYTCGVTAR